MTHPQDLPEPLTRYIADHRATHSRYDIDRTLLAAGHTPADIDAAWHCLTAFRPAPKPTYSAVRLAFAIFTICAVAAIASLYLPSYKWDDSVYNGFGDALGSIPPSRCANTSVRFYLSCWHDPDGPLYELVTWFFGFALIFAVPGVVFSAWRRVWAVGVMLGMAYPILIWVVTLPSLVWHDSAGSVDTAYPGGILVGLTSFCGYAAAVWAFGLAFGLIGRRRTP